MVAGARSAVQKARNARCGSSCRGACGLGQWFVVTRSALHAVPDVIPDLALEPAQALSETVVMIPGRWFGVGVLTT
eukprot:6382335-Lingulodinium_polyedra.AAC.1